MIRSMTAFANGERVTPWGTLGCELRSVNHRFLEIGVRLHDDLRALEPVLRERIAARISRGKLDITLRLRSPEGASGLHADPARLAELAKLAQDLSSPFPTLRVDFTQLLQFPGVLQAPATDAAALQAEALALLDEVLDEFIAAFDIENVNPNPARFDQKKAESINGDHIRMLAVDDFADRMLPYLGELVTTGRHTATPYRPRSRTSDTHGSRCHPAQSLRTAPVQAHDACTGSALRDRAHHFDAPSAVEERDCHPPCNAALTGAAASIQTVAAPARSGTAGASHERFS